MLTDDDIVDLRLLAGRHGRQQFQASTPVRRPRRSKPRRTTCISATRSARTAELLERFAILGDVPILDAQFGHPAPTDTCTDAAGDPRVCATDFALMYDGVVDFPEWILNPLSFVNAVAGFQYVHGTYLAPNGDDAGHRDAVRLHA